MKRTFLTLTMAAQMTSFAAFAQTSTATAEPGMATDTYGSDWSTTLGLAMFGADGTTIRPDAEIATQWSTLSDEDKSVIRRDCMVFLQQAGGMVGGDGSAADGSGTADGAPEGSGAATGGTGSATESPTVPTVMPGAGSDAITVTADQMQQVCTATRGL